MYEERSRKPINPECLVPTVKHGARSVMICAAISWYSVGPIIFLIGRITSSDYVDIIGDQVHRMVQRLFPKNVALFQDDISPIHSQKCPVLGCASWRYISTSSPDSTIARFKYHRTTVVTLRAYGEKQTPSIISQATRIRVLQYSTREYSERM